MAALPRAIQIERLEPGSPRWESWLPIELALCLCIRRATLFIHVIDPHVAQLLPGRGFVHVARHRTP